MAECVNCGNPVNGFVMVCPYCHTNPRHFGSQPYDGIRPIEPIDWTPVAEAVKGLGRWLIGDHGETKYEYVCLGAYGPNYTGLFVRRCGNCQFDNTDGVTKCRKCKKRFTGKMSLLFPDE